MANNVLIGCKLPSGLSLTLDGKEDGERVILNGMNTSRVAGGYGITSLEKEKSDQLFRVYKDHSAFKNNAIFTHGTDKTADLISVADELEGQKTGVEGINPENPGPGLKEEDENRKKREKMQTSEPPVRAPSKAEERAAAEEVAARKQK